VALGKMNSEMMSLTFSHTVARFGASFSAFGTDEARASWVVAPSKPRLV